MKKEWFFDRFCGRQFVALLEDGRLSEFAAEEESGGEIVGNVYKGKVMTVLSGMNAAFVYCGLERNCYLSTDETYADWSKYDSATAKAFSYDGTVSALKPGDEVIVQVVKPPRGTKGAKVTTHLSFVGKNLIYLPGTEFTGISRKIVDEEEKERLLKIASKLRSGEHEGYIVRTNAQVAEKKALKREWAYLKKLWEGTATRAKNAKVGELLHRDLELPVRIMRDSIGDEVEAMHVGDKALYSRLVSLARLREDFPEKKIRLYDGDRSLFREHGIMRVLRESTKSTVSLQGGGYIVIDHAEAMTVVDVNTGSFVGNNSLEQTVFEVNMRAAEEIARQVRLRNVGGIVVVDFIDMAEEEHRLAVTSRLTELLGRDKAKCKVLPMSEFCITEFTRKRVGREVLSYLVKPCEDCRGRGYVPADVFVIADIRADLFDKFREGFESVVVELNEGLMKKILSDKLLSEEARGRWKEKRIYLIPHKTFASSEYLVRGEKESVLDLPDKAQLLY